MLLSAALASGALAAGAQQSIPVRPLGAVVSKSTETFGVLFGVRGVGGGRVLVNDFARRRLVLLDSAMKIASVVADTVPGTPTAYGPRGSGIVPYFGDTTLFVDAGSQSLLVLNASGAVVKVMAPPKAADIFMLMSSAFGMAGVDAKGRLIYRSNFRILPMQIGSNVAPPQPPDSAPLVRASFETRSVDTIAIVKIPRPGRIRPNTSGGPSPGTAVINPLPFGDEFVVMSDGSIAIVRAQDYHIDWIDTDGTTRTSPKMPFEWRRLTDEQKQFYADSALNSFRKMFDSVMAIQAQQPLPPGIQRPVPPQLEAAPLSEIPDYLSPIGAVRPDPEGNLWILPTASSQLRPGKVYDVINKKGEIFERVELPPGRMLEGFGPNGVVYLSVKEGTQTFLERARIR